MIFRKPLILLLLFAFTSTLRAGVDVDMWLYTDSLQVYKPHEVFRTFPERFQHIEEETMNFGLTKKDYWFVLDIKNGSGETVNYKFVIDYSLLKGVSFYEAGNYSIQQRKELISSHAYIYKLEVTPYTKKQYMLHVEGEGMPVILPFEIDTTENIFVTELWHTFALGSFYGILLLAIILTLILSVFSRDKIFRFLLIYLVGAFFYFSIADGFVFRQGISKDVLLQYKIMLILPLILVPVLEQFVKKYFGLSSISQRRISRFIHLLSSAVFVLIISGLFDAQYNFWLANMYVIVAQLIIIVPLFKLTHLQRRSTTIMIFSLAFLLAGFVIDFALKTGQIHVSVFTLNALRTGFLLHIATFLLGTFDRYQILRKKADLFNQKLGDLVKEKTAEINQQKEELVTQTEQLEYQKEELESQKEELQTQKEILENQNIRLERLSLAASNTENVIYIFDTKGVLEWFNESFSSQLGMSFEDYKQSDKEILIFNISSYHQIHDVVNLVLTNQKSVTYESKIEVDGKDRWFQTTLTPVKENSEIKYIVAIDSDISRLKEYEEQLHSQRVDFEEQRNLAIKRRKEVEDQQREITDSLNYAQRIQSAILPSPAGIARFFPESFVLFMPRDIVSGDFYWFHRIENKYIYVVVDCTGHGVPGAFMSIIGIYLLNNIIIQNNETRPAEILKQLNRKLKISLKNTLGSQTNDGMDVSLTVVDKNESKLYYAGSLRPLYLFQKGSFLEQKGDKNPITSTISGNTMASFTEYEFDIESGDRFYMFSDGITDQFGGKRNKKFLSKRLKQVLFDAQMYNMAEQKKILQKAIIDWKGNNIQVDDILLVGVKI